MMQIIKTKEVYAKCCISLVPSSLKGLLVSYGHIVLERIILHMSRNIVFVFVIEYFYTIFIFLVVTFDYFNTLTKKEVFVGSCN